MSAGYQKFYEMVRGISSEPREECVSVLRVSAYASLLYLEVLMDFIELVSVLKNHKNFDSTD